MRRIGRRLAPLGPRLTHLSIEVDVGAYGRFTGRFSEPLAVGFADLAGVTAGQRAFDVGCGPGALTAVLADRLGPDHVAAADPSPPFVSALEERLPGVEVHLAPAERLPFADGTFDLALAQLVVQFMSDPVAGLAEMARVTRTGGLVASCTWDHGGGHGPLSTFWQAAVDVDPATPDERSRPGTSDGELVELTARAGLTDVRQATLTVRSSYADFDAWWQPYTLAVGTAGEYLASIDTAHRDAVRARCAQLLPDGPFEIEATAWTALGRV